MSAVHLVAKSKKDSLHGVVAAPLSAEDLQLGRVDGAIGGGDAVHIDLANEANLGRLVWIAVAAGET